jgi:hypothetical protein
MEEAPPSRPEDDNAEAIGSADKFLPLLLQGEQLEKDEERGRRMLALTAQSIVGLVTSGNVSDAGCNAVMVVARTSAIESAAAAAAAMA